ncbi:MAG: hypothetical protein ABH803_04055 [Candidatus Micrarchaeota archaeon]
MKKAITSLIIAILLLGCTSTTEIETPSDFSFIYSTGAMHTEWGVYHLEVKENGEATYTKTIEETSKEYKFNLSQKEKSALYETMIKNNFFSLKETYKDPSIMDGGFSELNVHANNKWKKVTVENYYLEEFENIEREISILLRKKLDAPFSFDDVLNDLEDE